MATVLLTGATDGLGRALARELAQAGERVLVHGRDRRRGEDALAETGAAQLFLADFARLDDVRALAAAVGTVDVLVNNAGIGSAGERAESHDGLELRFQVNYLAGYLPASLLSPPRVVNVASAGQYPIDFDDPMLERDYSGLNAYRQSKLAQIMFTIDLAEELRGTGVTVNALHPASLMNTAMVREADYETLSTVEEGGTATMRLIADPSMDGITGTYSNGLHEAKANDQAYDPTIRARLRALSDELINRVLG
jgi:NAD(P)-dependent dehydrogenase (short-subunit alcohol dehydrogenase family)